MKRIVTLGAIAIVVATLSACHPTRRSEPIVGPFVATDPALERGRLLYDRHCYKCHTEGEGGLAPALNNKPLPRFLMRFQVRAGLGAMPGFSREELSNEDLDAVVDYIVALRHHYKK